jgi:hypothetical protein
MKLGLSPRNYFMRKLATGALTDENLVDRLSCVLVDVLQPVFNVLEALLVCHVVHEQNTHSIAVMGRLIKRTGGGGPSEEERNGGVFL